MIILVYKTHNSCLRESLGTCASEEPSPTKPTFNVMAISNVVLLTKIAETGKVKETREEHMRNRNDNEALEPSCHNSSVTP
ncbi:unnamed protein product [Lathyrus oleraceus]